MAIVLMTSMVTDADIPRAGLGALAMLPLAAALVDSVRLYRGRPANISGPDGDGGREGQGSDSDLKEWLEERASALNAREQELNTKALALQQWMQFPDVIDFRQDAQAGPGERSRGAAHDQGPTVSVDPMAKHDRELVELIERKTRKLFDDIKQDAYRKDVGGQRVFDNDRIRADAFALVSDVAAIYRPGESSPLLQTNIESLSRAVGRAPLRLLVAVENLPGGLANYDFQSIYNLVIRAVKTFGLYKSAKPYLDVASGVLFAGRIASSINPLTLAAWWAAGKATTYGASKLGNHLIDQQAVGLIRQLVEIVAIEVASVYSPMVRYRDLHWIYGVELVHLASVLSVSTNARVEAMKQLASLNLRDEYGRVSLMRHLATGSTSRPANYRPSESLSLADREIVARRLEAFLLAFVLNDGDSHTNSKSIETWQASVSDRLEIRFHQGQIELSDDEQLENAAWSLDAFALEHCGEEPDAALESVHETATWGSLDSTAQSKLNVELTSKPPYLYHPPTLDPKSDICKQFMEDLLVLASRQAKPLPEPATSTGAPDGPILLTKWTGEEAIGITAYYLRRDADACLAKFHRLETARLFGGENATTISRATARGLDYLIQQVPEAETTKAVFSDATVQGTGDKANLARIGSKLSCFTVRETGPSGQLTLQQLSRCDVSQAKIEKLSGYVRSDCQITFPDGVQVRVPGSTLGSYDSYFAGLLEP